MPNLKSLAKDTAIYGLSSIVARFVNYLLVPIQTMRFTADGGEYGVITNVYAYTALLIIVLTYGMETTFFRFMNKDGESRDKVYSTTLRMVGFTSLLFCILVVLFRQPLADIMGYGDHPEYVWVLFVTVGIDAFSCILFDYLRCIHRPIKFAVLKIAAIVLNILLNILYLIVMPELHLNPFGIYDSAFHLDVAWVFYINMFCTISTTLLLWRECKGITNGFDKLLCKRMLAYSMPIFVMGIAGQLNQCLSQILFPYLYDGTPREASTQLGIYGACIKVAMIMVMITQAFRFAYEPFVFGKSRDSDNKETYAKVMKFYIIFTLLAFLAVVGYIDVLRYVVGKSYWDGLRVVPIVMAAEIMFGVFFNLSFWYKLTDRTIWGAWFSGLGCIVLIAVNVLFVPVYGYMACAWAGFAAYGISMVVSYFAGQKYYPVPYPLREIAFYVVVAIVLFVAIEFSNATMPLWGAISVNTLLLAVFAGIIIRRDMPLSALPIVGRYFHR